MFFGIRVRLVVCKLRSNLMCLRRFCTIYDKNFDYFRGKAEYKNSVVQLNSELRQDKTAGPEFSFILREQNIHTDGFYSHLQQRENVMKMSSVQVKEILCLMANTQIDTAKYALALKYLDEKCALSVERWPLDLSFYILDAWFIIWGPKAFRKYYYSAITSQWGRRMRKCSKFNLILMLYFIGMSKSPPPFLMESIEDRMENYVSDFSDEEYAVACLSFFKTSRKLSSNLILKRSCLAAQNLLMKNDRFNAISVLKCLRLSKFYDPKLWQILKDFTLKEYALFNFVECTNFLAVFATQNIYDKEVYSCLETRGLAVLHTEQSNSLGKGEVDLKMHPSKRSRVKDLGRFMWALSSMGHSSREETLRFINDFLVSRLESDEFDHQLHILVDILQSQVLFGFYSESLLKSVLISSTFKNVLHQERAKPKYQLYFVQKSVKIEHPESQLDSTSKLFNMPIPKNLDKEMKERKGFMDIVKFLSDHSVNFKACYLMPHIMIAGIILSKEIPVDNRITEEQANKSFAMYQKYLEGGIISKQVKDIFNKKNCYVCLEILDPSVCIKDSAVPLGLMKAKIRQLRKLNFDVLVLSSEEIFNLTTDNLSGSNENIERLRGIL